MAQSTLDIKGVYKCVIKLLQAPKAIKGWAAELFTRLFITG